MAALISARRHSPLRHEHRRRALALEHAVHQHAVLAVARQVELRVVVEQLQVPARYEARVPHVHVHLSPARVSPYHHPLLPDDVLKVPPVEPRDRHRRRLLRPLHLRRRRGRRLQGQERPCVALRAPRELSLGHVRHARTVSPTLSTRGACTCTRAHHKRAARSAAFASRPGYPKPAESVPTLQFEVTDGTHMRKVSTCAVNKNYINHHTTT